MPATPTYALPFPSLTDTPDVPRDLEALALAVEAELSEGEVGRGANLPASPADGQLFEWVIDDAAGVQWLMRFNAAGGAYKWEFVGGPAKQERSDAEAGGSTLPAHSPSGPPITMPKSGQWAFEFGGMLFVGSGPANIGVIQLSLHVAGVAVGHPVYCQAGAGMALDLSAVDQRTVAKGALVTLGTGLASGSTGSTQFRWLRWHPLRVAND
jgi:hypothetical protein